MDEKQGLMPPEPRKVLSPHGQSMTYAAEDLAELGRGDLYFFCKYILGYKDMELQPHRRMCDNVMRRRERKQRYGMDLWPRGHYKTSVITVGSTLWELAGDPDLKNLIDNETKDKAMDISDEINNHILFNEVFKACYGDWCGKPLGYRWKRGDMVIATRESLVGSKDASIGCSGTDSGTTGKHYDRIKCDDLVGETNYYSPEMRTKTLEHFRALVPLLNPGGFLDIIGTRWDPDDLYSFVMSELADLFKDAITIEPAILEDGSYLFPAVFDAQVIEEKRKLMGERLFAANYMNDPMPSERSVFKAEWIKFFRDIDLSHAYIASMIDPSLGDSRKSDYTAFVTAAMLPNRQIFVLEAKQLRCTEMRMVQEAYRIRDQWNPRWIGLEMNAHQRLYKYAFAEECRRRQEAGIENPMLTLRPIEPMRGLGRMERKHDRFMTLANMMEQGRVYLGRAQTALLEQVKNYSGENSLRYDDLLDGLAYLVRELYAQPAPVAKTKEELAQERFNAFMEEIGASDRVGLRRPLTVGRRNARGCLVAG